MRRKQTPFCLARILDAKAPQNKPAYGAYGFQSLKSCISTSRLFIDIQQRSPAHVKRTASKTTTPSTTGESNDTAYFGMLDDLEEIGGGSEPSKDKKESSPREPGRSPRSSRGSKNASGRLRILPKGVSWKSILEQVISEQPGKVATSQEIHNIVAERWPDVVGTLKNYKASISVALSQYHFRRIDDGWTLPDPDAKRARLGKNRGSPDGSMEGEFKDESFREDDRDRETELEGSGEEEGIEGDQEARSNPNRSRRNGGDTEVQMRAERGDERPRETKVDEVAVSAECVPDTIRRPSDEVPPMSPRTPPSSPPTNPTLLSDSRITDLVISVFDRSSPSRFSSAPQIVDTLVALGIAHPEKWSAWRVRILEVMRSSELFKQVEGTWKEMGGPMRSGRPPTMWELTQNGRSMVQSLPAFTSLKRSASEASVNDADVQNSGPLSPILSSPQGKKQRTSGESD
ncbi:hypothetical protein M427DRAFT_382454 [Gonapodya prolifera JEL478]|uniref:Uncharacterized protein n=1 Tax=Gonapodya prolifera (strain JEL478) TaxID=1344416 RepID=A0A139A975_GONPJ|nr:hypothetical protein M427DRAFT_382454 [Gonapodya prolifera JEL478]|eukprot:KXS13297.1 hypothetical protein M427DRAFT_382454 [Gonapodya prolifera JEL478]